MFTREEAETAQQQLQGALIDNSILIKVGWGAGFGPKDGFDFVSGDSVIPIDSMKDQEKKWVYSTKRGGGPLESGMVMEEPDVQIGPKKDTAYGVPADPVGNFGQRGRGGFGGFNDRGGFQNRGGFHNNRGGFNDHRGGSNQRGGFGQRDNHQFGNQDNLNHLPQFNQQPQQFNNQFREQNTVSPQKFGMNQLPNQYQNQGFQNQQDTENSDFRPNNRNNQFANPNPDNDSHLENKQAYNHLETHNQNMLAEIHQSTPPQRQQPTSIAHAGGMGFPPGAASMQSFENGSSNWEQSEMNGAKRVKKE